jgi:hypothetical protein
VGLEDALLFSDAKRGDGHNKTLHVHEASRQEYLVSLVEFIIYDRTYHCLPIMARSIELSDRVSQSHVRTDPFATPASAFSSQPSIARIGDRAASTDNIDEAIGDRAPQGVQEFSLPPVDGGKDAWLFLAACFVVEALVWGE